MCSLRLLTILEPAPLPPFPHVLHHSGIAGVLKGHDRERHDIRPACHGGVSEEWIERPGRRCSVPAVCWLANI